MCLQSFYFRLHNWFQYALMKFLVMSDKAPAEAALSKKYGYKAVGSWASRSTAPAVIATGDWALEYPYPLPPKVHVSS